MMNIKNYVRVTSLEEAYQLNQKKSNRLIGGMTWLKMSRAGISTAIDMSDLGLDTIEETEDEFIIGAMVSLRQLELHESLNKYTDGMIRKAVRDIVGVQFRNTATIGGSIFGRYGFSDVLTAFLAAETYVELYKGGIMSLESFTNIERNRDVLVRVIVKKTPGRFAYQAMRIARTDFPVLTCAVSHMKGRYRAVIGARPGKAKVFTGEMMQEDGAGEKFAANFALKTAENIPMGSNSRGSKEYRKHLARVLTERCIKELGGLDNGN